MWRRGLSGCWVRRATGRKLLRALQALDLRHRHYKRIAWLRSVGAAEGGSWGTRATAAGDFEAQAGGCTIVPENELNNADKMSRDASVTVRCVAPFPFQKRGSPILNPRIHEVPHLGTLLDRTKTACVFLSFAVASEGREALGAWQESRCSFNFATIRKALERR